MCKQKLSFKVKLKSNSKDKNMNVVSFVVFVHCMLPLRCLIIIVMFILVLHTSNLELLPLWVMGTMEGNSKLHRVGNKNSHSCQSKSIKLWIHLCNSTITYLSPQLNLLPLDELLCLLDAGQSWPPTAYRKPPSAAKPKPPVNKIG